jgi:hypothetical protein
MSFRGLLACSLTIAFSLVTASPGSHPVPDNCEAPEYGRLDFVVGKFTMRTVKGVLAGTLQFEKKLGGCVVFGRWSGSQGGQGEVSLYFDRSDQRWHQLYIADDGWVLRFTGGFDGQALVMTGMNTFADGRRGLQRMTWALLPDGTLRQFWEMTDNSFSNWQTLFDARGSR